jgi:hypothetical protein
MWIRDARRGILGSLSGRIVAIDLITDRDKLRQAPSSFTVIKT